MGKTTYTKSKLSERQTKILVFIEAFINENGYPPTIREIGEAVQIGSTSVVNYNLNKLVNEGYLERSHKVSRGLQLVRKPDGSKVEEKKIRAIAKDELFPVPLIGSIVASAPVELPGDDFGYYYDQDDVVDLPASLFGKIPQEDIYALKVRGHSMIDAMVDDGDVVVLCRQQIAQDGDMVAVWLKNNNETTLKYFFREDKRVRLQPANPTMDPIFVPADQVSIQGRVLVVLRSL